MDLGSAMQTPGNPPTSSAVICHRCGKRGHIRRDCRVKLGPNKGSQGRAGGYQGQKARFADQAAAADVAPQALPPPPPARRQAKN